MTYTECFYETHDPLLALAPDTYVAGAEIPLAYVEGENYHRFVLVAHIGTVAQGGDIHFTIYSASTALGANLQTLHTQNYTAAGIYATEVTSASFTPGNHFIMFSYDVDVANVNASAILYGIVSRYEPIPAVDWAGTHGP